MINILDDEDKQIIKISKQPLKEYDHKHGLKSVHHHSNLTFSSISSNSNSHLNSNNNTNHHILSAKKICCYSYSKTQNSLSLIKSKSLKNIIPKRYFNDLYNYSLSNNLTFKTNAKKSINSYELTRNNYLIKNTASSPIIHSNKSKASSNSFFSLIMTKEEYEKIKSNNKKKFSSSEKQDYIFLGGINISI